MLEHRLSKRLTDYWDRVRNDNQLPSIDVFNPSVIDDLWQKCFQVSLVMEDGKPIYTYDFIGKELEIIFGSGLAGQKVKSKLSFMPARKMIEHMDNSIKNPFPIIIEGQFVDEYNKVIKYRSCLLPFGRSRDKISHFVIGVSWKSF